MRPLLIIEPNLRGPSGHYGEFVRALGMHAGENAVDVFAHPQADEMLAAMNGVRACTDEPRVGCPLAEWRMIVRAVREDIPFLVLTSDGRHAAAVSLSALLAKRQPRRAHLYFHQAPTKPRDSFFLTMSAEARKHASAIAPTAKVADSLRDMGWQHVEYVPYPALAEEKPPQPVPFSHLLMAGAARLNKGLDLVADLAGRWAGEGRSLPLWVQVSKKHAKRHGHREVAVVEALLSSGYSGLVASDKAPERAEYVERFHGALVLAPYERERFSEAVSGVVLDALLHGAPVIATKGTWPGAQVERFGAGVTIEDRSAAALATAIDTVLAKWPDYTARACQAAVVLKREHDPERLLTLLSLSKV